MLSLTNVAWVNPRHAFLHVSTARTPQARAVVPYSHLHVVKARSRVLSFANPRHALFTPHPHVHPKRVLLCPTHTCMWCWSVGPPTRMCSLNTHLKVQMAPHCVPLWCCSLWVGSVVLKLVGPAHVRSRSCTHTHSLIVAAHTHCEWVRGSCMWVHRAGHHFVYSYFFVVVLSPLLPEPPPTIHCAAVAACGACMDRERRARYTAKQSMSVLLLFLLVPWWLVV